ncbi:hypothetical protein ABPG74_004944 [Tetrahymena malaccensis]
MGQLLNSNSKDYLLEIRKLSLNKINLDDINYLQVQTSFTPEELYSLYQKFASLGTPRESNLSIYEFMRLEELINCPFMPRLPDGLDLKYQLEAFLSKQDIENAKNTPTEKQQNQSQNKEKLQKKESLKSREQKKVIIDNSTVMLQSSFSSFKNNINQLDIKFIDFKLFVMVLNVFSPQASTAIKTKFMFKIFDFDNDGVLQFKDIFQGIKMMYSDHNLKECKLTDNEITSLVMRIFYESDISQEDGFKYEDFQLNLWETDFEKQCSIYF